MQPEHAEQRTHDGVRHGATQLVDRVGYRHQEGQHLAAPTPTLGLHLADGELRCDPATVGTSSKRTARLRVDRASHWGRHNPPGNRPNG
jgi:hypothetical protein